MFFNPKVGVLDRGCWCNDKIISFERSMNHNGCKYKYINQIGNIVDVSSVNTMSTNDKKYLYSHIDLNIPQSIIHFASPIEYDRHHPDYYKLILMNHILKIKIKETNKVSDRMGFINIKGQSSRYVTNS